MYHMIAAKDPTHLCRGKHGRKWQIATESSDLAAPALGSVRCRKQQRGLSGTDRLANFLKAGDRNAGPPRQTDRLTATLRQ
jgi:hypothetical protein